MDYRVIWSHRAKSDLVQIGEFISRDSATNASAVVAKMRFSARSLARFPFHGRIVPEAIDGAVREFFVFNYRIIYEIYESKRLVAILMVAHMARDISREFVDISMN